MVNNKYNFMEFSSPEELSNILCKEIISVLSDAISVKGYATLVVSGGLTPKSLFSKLSVMDIPWNKVRITLVDERWVDPTSEKSNEKLVRDYLLQNHAKNARFVPLKTDGKYAKDSIVCLEVELEKLSHELDVVVIGMGADGHTASFFSASKGLSHALETNDLVCATLSRVEPKERITLSRKYLLCAKKLFLHIEGEVKKDVFLEATKSDDMFGMPIVSMMQQEKPLLEVFYAD